MKNQDFEKAHQQHVFTIRNRVTTPDLTAIDSEDARARSGIPAGLMCMCTCSCRVIERR